MSNNDKQTILCDRHDRNSRMWLEQSPFAVSAVYCCGELDCNRHYGPNFGYFSPATYTPPYIDPIDRGFSPCPEKGEAHRYMALTASESGSKLYCFDCGKHYESETSLNRPISAWRAASTKAS